MSTEYRLCRVVLDYAPLRAQDCPFSIIPNQCMFGNRDCRCFERTKNGKRIKKNAVFHFSQCPYCTTELILPDIDESTEIKFVSNK